MGNASRCLDVLLRDLLVFHVKHTGVKDNLSGLQAFLMINLNHFASREFVRALLLI